jgi:hypothetical protein
VIVSVFISIEITIDTLDKAIIIFILYINNDFSGLQPLWGLDESPSSVEPIKESNESDCELQWLIQYPVRSIMLKLINHDQYFLNLIF